MNDWLKPHCGQVKPKPPIKAVNYYYPNNATLLRSNTNQPQRLNPSDGVFLAALLGAALASYNPVKDTLVNYDSQKAQQDYLNQLDDYWYY